jgi:hypothetical protein
MYDMNKHDACTFHMSSHPSRILKFLTLGDGIHTLYHIGKTTSLLICAVSVPAEDSFQRRNPKKKHTLSAYLDYTVHPLRCIVRE